MSSKYFKYVCYADDTTLFLSINISEYNPTETEELINNELEKVNLWLKLNKTLSECKENKMYGFPHSTQKSNSPQDKT